jgi:hypothetical protein
VASSAWWQSSWLASCCTLYGSGLYLQSIQRCVAGFMVNTLARATVIKPYVFSAWPGFKESISKRVWWRPCLVWSRHCLHSRRGVPLERTHGNASSGAKGVELNGTTLESANSCCKREGRTNHNPTALPLTRQNPWWETGGPHQPQPNGANPDTAESMVGNERTALLDGLPLRHHDHFDNCSHLPQDFVAECFPFSRPLCARPLVFRRKLQCQPVRGVNTRDECHWSHACKSFKRASVGTNGILECKFLSKNEHRASTRLLAAIELSSSSPP